MTLLITQPLAWAIALICAIGAVIWMRGEWRRVDRRNRPYRILAVLFTLAALATLGLRPAIEEESTNVPPAPEDAALWTSTIASAPILKIPRDVSPDHIFALPDAAKRPSNARIIPDVAFILRAFPNVRTLHIFGDGVDAYESEALRKVRVIFHPGAAESSPPSITFVRYPVAMNLGEPVVVQGRVNGIPTDAAPVISILAPDGSARSVTLAPGSDGVATFSLMAPPAVAAGRYVWKLELRNREAGEILARENIGVSVIKPAIPRILVIESAPRIDTGRLKRWLGERGAELTIRSQLGRERFRITSTQGSRESVEALDAASLAAFDLIVADSGVVSGLSESEREVLRAAVNDDGLGVLIVADDARLDAGAVAGGAPRDDFFLPWKSVGGGPGAAGEDRLSRLRWLGSESASPEPLAVPSLEVSREPWVQPMVRDGQDRVLVASTPRGRGRVAFSLIRQTWPWTQLKDSTAFASYWSFLFSELARREAGLAGRWSIANDNGGPRFVNEPIMLGWNGDPNHAPMPAQIWTEGQSGTERLPLAQSATNPHQWESTYWPRVAGWHRVAAPAGATLDFFVSDSSDWSSLQAARRRSATSTIAVWSAAREPAPVATPLPAPVEFGRWWFMAVLFASLTYLWSEARTLRQSHPVTHNP